MPIAESTSQIGAAAPEFALEGSAGTVRLSDYRDRQHVVLYFMRAFACSACRHHAAALAKSYADLQSCGATVLVIGLGRPQDAKRMAERLSLPFPVLADPDGHVYQSFGLTRAMLLVQTSATLLIDKQGVLRYAHRAANPYASFNGPELLTELAKCNAPYPAEV